jgi:hypothetical protein
MVSDRSGGKRNCDRAVGFEACKDWLTMPGRLVSNLQRHLRLNTNGMRHAHIAVRRAVMTDRLLLAGGPSSVVSYHAWRDPDARSHAVGMRHVSYWRLARRPVGRSAPGATGARISKREKSRERISAPLHPSTINILRRYLVRWSSPTTKSTRRWRAR